MPNTAKLIKSRLIHYLINALCALCALVVILALALPIGFYGMAMYISPRLPSVDEIKTANLEMPLQIYSRDNQLIGQYGNRMSLPVKYEHIPKPLIQAFLAAEDASFYEHTGISIKGLGRAITEVISDEEAQTGGSTITMQVAKNYFLTPERTFNRKLTELYLARRIEEHLSKEEILTLYVNKIYMGEGAYGVRAGAKKYYSKSLDKLSVAQMAMLAGLPKAPSQNNPVANPENALVRRNWILGRMHGLGYLTDKQYEEALAEPIGLRLYQETLDVNMPYLAEMARQAMVSQYGDAVINSGWRVRLTVDSKAQSDAESAVERGIISYDMRHGWRGVEASAQQLLQEEGIEGGASLQSYVSFNNMYPAKVTEVASRSFKALLKDGREITVPWSGMSWAKLYLDANRIAGYPSQASRLVAKDDIVRVSPTADNSWRLTQVPKVQGSMVALDPETGALQALIGGFDFKHSKFNRATQGWRQPGSTIKPLIYATALEKGYRPDSLVSDTALQVGSWKPKNSDGRYYGEMTLRQGLYLSRNLVSIRLLRSVGIEDARHLLDQFGLDKDKLPTTLSLALGAGQATPLQMATAYAAFANGGHRVQPYFIDQIYNFDQVLLYQANPQRACATCFNKDLEEINERLVEAYEAQLAKEEDMREQQLNTLSENPELLASIDVLLAEDVELISSKLTEEKGQSDEDTDSSIDQADKNKGSSVLSKTVELKDVVYAVRYNEAPINDRLKATLVQYAAANQAPRILTSAVAYEMAGMLRDVIQKGTAKRALAMGRDDIGGKTGTTNDTKDAWFAGFHPSLVSVVWVGFDKPSTLGKKEYGGVAALPIWMDFMSKQLSNQPERWVSFDNISKSEKQDTEVIDITNETLGEADTTTPVGDEQSIPDPEQNIPTPSVLLRPSSSTSMISNRKIPVTSSAQESLSNSSQQQRQSIPLVPEKVDELPALQ